MKTIQNRDVLQRAAVSMAVCAVWLAAVPAVPSTFPVLNTQDAGENSLRWAIEQANTNAGPDEVTFAIPRTDPGFNGTVWTIKPLSPLPVLSDGGTTVDGLYQTAIDDANPDGPEIFIDGRNAGASASGLTVQSADNTVSGLTISGFDISGIQILSENSDRNRVSGCYLGTDPAGETAIPNRVGVLIGNDADENTIGVMSGSFINKNVISGNSQYGVEIYGARDNSVFFNFIGTDRSGTSGLGNGWCGVWISGGSRNNTVGSGSPCSNVISGNG
ncbi:hypothetical protein JW777_06985, partial [bacterium]|nr:hypothetical protein [bacterium]